MVSIPLQEFTLEVPTVNKLAINPIASPRVIEGLGLVQDVYYALHRADGRKVEEGNKSIPLDIYLLVQKYITGTVDQDTIDTLTAFFVAADWEVIKPIIPPVVETPEAEPEA